MEGNTGIVPRQEAKCPALSRGWSSPGGEQYKIMSVTILDRGEVYVFLKSGRLFFFSLHFKSCQLCVYILQLPAASWKSHKHSHSVAESSASRQRKWFLLLFLCVVLHHLVGSCGWVACGDHSSGMYLCVCKACLLLLYPPLLFPC